MKMSMNKKSKTPKNFNPERHPFYRNNLNKMKAVIIRPSFKTLVDDFLVRRGDVLDQSFVQQCWEWGGYTELKIKKDFLKLLNPEDQRVLTLLTDVLQKEIEQITEQSELPKHFAQYVWEWLVNGNLNAPALNFNFYMGSTPEKIKVVSVNVYSRLSTKEKEIMCQFLDTIQQSSNYTYVHKKQPTVRNFDKYFQIVQEAKDRQRPKIKEQYTSQFVDTAYKNWMKGDIQKKEFETIKKLNPNGVEKIKIGKTSKDVAQKVLGSRAKHPNVRQILSRFKKISGQQV